MDWLWAAIAFAVWFGVSRYLFRMWVRCDTFTSLDAKCEHGYGQIDRGLDCHGRHPWPRSGIASLAMLAALFVPVVLILAGIIYKTPVSRADMEKKTADLEQENAKLQRMIDGMR